MNKITRVLAKGTALLRNGTVQVTGLELFRNGDMGLLEMINSKGDVSTGNIYARGEDWLALACAIEELFHNRPPASPELIAEARRLYQPDSCADIMVDDDAVMSLAEDGAWVSAWVWVPKEE